MSGKITLLKINVTPSIAPNDIYVSSDVTGKACKCQMPCDIREHCDGTVEYFNCENKCDNNTIWGTIFGVWWSSPYDVH